MLKEALYYLLYMIPGFIATGLVIFIHELGHFFASRLLGADVEVLGYGFGPVLWRHYGKKTEFRISLIPFGGYCRITGSEDLSVALKKKSKRLDYVEEGSFFGISPWKKFLIFLSGPLTNLILAIILLVIVSSLPVKRISHPLLVTPSSLYPTLFSSSIEQEELNQGDIILSSGDRSFLDWEDFSSWLSEKNKEEINLTVLRNNERVNVSIKGVKGDNGKYSYGIANLEEAIIGRSEDPLFQVGDRIIKANGKAIKYSYDLYELNDESFHLTLLRGNEEIEVEWNSTKFPFAWKANTRVYPDSSHPFKSGFGKAKTLISKTFLGVVKLLSFQFKEALEVISGPFTSASSIGRITTIAFSTSASSGLRTLFYLLSIVSISIFIGNLIPIPSFDGGQMLIAGAEMIMHRPLKPHTYLYLHIFGVVIAWLIIIIMNAWGFIEKLL